MAKKQLGHLNEEDTDILVYLLERRHNTMSYSYWQTNALRVVKISPWSASRKNWHEVVVCLLWTEPGDSFYCMPRAPHSTPARHANIAPYPSA